MTLFCVKRITMNEWMRLGGINNPDLYTSRAKISGKLLHFKRTARDDRAVHNNTRKRAVKSVPISTIIPADRPEPAHARHCSNCHRKLNLTIYVAVTCGDNYIRLADNVGGLNTVVKLCPRCAKLLPLGFTQ